MRLKKKDAFISAMKNVKKRALLVDKAEEKYKKAIDRLRAVESKFTKEELTELRSGNEVSNVTSTGTGSMNTYVFTMDNVLNETLTGV